MAKKKKKKSARNQNQLLQQQAPESLREQAESFLSSGKPREAVRVLKAAIKQQGPAGSCGELMFRAYLMREQQLRRKKMDAEAEAVFKQALAYFPPHDRMKEEDLVLFSACAPLDRVVAAYGDWLAVRPVSPAVERQLADRLIASEKWHLLEGLDPQIPIRRDAKWIMEAMPRMNAGDWETALELLNPVPRSSPFSPLRLLCRGMTAFYARQDADLVKAFSMIPPDFLLHPFAEALKKFISRPETSPDHDLVALQGMFAGVVGAETRVRRLLQAFTGKYLRDTTAEIRTLARTIHPEDPDACVMEILEILMLPALREEQSTRFFAHLIRSLVSREKEDSLVLRSGLFADIPLASAAGYIRRISCDFPDPGCQAVAKSLVILEAIRQSRKRHTFTHERHRDIDEDAFDRLPSGPSASTPWHLLGIESGNHEMAYLEMVREGISCDPGNRQWYELIITLPAMSAPAKKIVEGALQTMAAHFPDDPFPHIELASLYLRKSAFRKAERALEAAAGRAPYDNRVVEKKAAFHLRSASLHLDRNKPHLAADDLEKAESLNSRRAALHTREKRILFTYLKDVSAGETLLSEMLADLSGAGRIRLLFIFLVDLLHGVAARKLPPKIVKPVRARLNSELKTLSDLQPAEALELITLPPADFRMALPPHGPKMFAEIFTVRQLSKILSFVADADIIAACDNLLGTGEFKMLHTELGRRLKNQKSSPPHMMVFYHEILRDMSGRKTDFKRIVRLIVSVDAETRSNLEEAARRLAPHARGRMTDILDFFDFEFFGSDSFGFDDDEFDDDEFDDDGFDFDPPCPISISGSPPADSGQASADLEQSSAHARTIGFFGDMTPEKIIEELEGIIDRMRLRDAPEYVLTTLRNTIKTKIRPETEGLKEFLEDYPVDFTERLSREAKIVFIN